MKRFFLSPLVVAATFAAGAAGAQQLDDAQSYGVVERDSVTYQEPLARDGDAYGAVYGSGQADDYHDYSDYGDDRADDYADDGPEGVYQRNAARDGYAPVITPDRYGRDGAHAMARVVQVDELVSRDAGCGGDDRYAYEDGGYRGVPASDGYHRDDGYYRDDGYVRDDGYYRDEPYQGGYGYGGGYGGADPYGRPPPPRTSGIGAAIGAVLGGVIGNAVVDDDDHGYYGYSGEKAAATMVGAVLGGAIGNGIEREAVRRREQAYYGGRQGAYGGAVRQDGAYDQRVSGCDRVDGYRVTYEYAGRRYETVTDYHPGDEMRVRIEMLPNG
jgi:uncharacterized protein YcfJ